MVEPQLTERKETLNATAAARNEIVLSQAEEQLIVQQAERDPDQELRQQIAGAGKIEP